MYRVWNASYDPVSYEDVWGSDLRSVIWPASIDTACEDPDGSVVLSALHRATVAAAYDAIAYSIAAYEASSEFKRLLLQVRLDVWRWHEAHA